MTLMFQVIQFLNGKSVHGKNISNSSRKVDAICENVTQCIQILHIPLWPEAILKFGSMLIPINIKPNLLGYPLIHIGAPEDTRNLTFALAILDKPNGLGLHL